MFRQVIVDEIVQYLLGSCKALYELYDPEELSLEELRAIDDVIFLCEVCGWWYDMEDLDDNQICIDCAHD